MSDRVPPTGTLVRALAADRAVRVLALEATALAEHTRKVHGLGAEAAELGGEALVAASLASAHIKGDEQLALQVQGDHPRCSVYVDATAAGAVRCRVTPADLVRRDGRIAGVLLVTKHVPGYAPYRGATRIDGESFSSAIRAHFGESTQVDAIVRLGCTVKRDRDAPVAWAGGLLVERLPEEPDLPSLAPAAFVERYGWIRDVPMDELMFGVATGKLGSEPLEVLESLSVRWQCRCSLAKVEETLAALGPAELRAMIEEDHGAHVVCHFCNAEHPVSEARLRELLDRSPHPAK